VRVWRLVGAWTFVISVVWCLAGLGFVVFGGVDRNSSDEANTGNALLIIGAAFGSVGAVAGLVLFGIADHLAEERRWRSDLRRGTVTMHDLRPGETSATSATQTLTCRLEIRVAGLEPADTDYRTDVGPLDAPRLVEGATFACQASPSVPDRVRVWLLAAPDGGELTGRYLDFRPAH